MSSMNLSGPLAPLSVRDFRYLLTGFAIGQMLMPLQFITQILWVQHYAPRDIWLILVALIATCRGLGALLFGLYGGALADRFDRRQLLLVILALQIVGTALIAALMWQSGGGTLGFVLFFLLTFLTAGLQAVDGAARLAIVPDVLGPTLTPAGMSLNQLAAQIAMPVAMAMTGIIIDVFGFAGAYLASAAGYVVAMIFLALINYRASADQHMAATGRFGLLDVLVDVREGLVYAWHHKVVFWVIALMVLMMGLGYPATASLGPTWVTTVVGVEISRMGFVVMFWGIGSFIGALVLTQLSSSPHRGVMLGAGAIMFAVSFNIFVGAPTELNAIIGNLGLGAGMALAMTSSTILIQHLVPNEVRGRIMSIFQMNFAFAQLMTMPVAVAAQWLTLEVLFPWLSLATLVVVVMILAGRPQLWRARIELNR